MIDKKLLLLLVLGSMAVLSLLYGVITPSKPWQQYSQTAARPENISLAALPAVKPPEMPHARSPLTTWGKNPFEPLFQKKPPAMPTGDLFLTGIAWDPNNPNALINDEIVQVGDEILGFTVLEINRTSVTLGNSDGKKVLHLEEPPTP